MLAAFPPMSSRVTFVKFTDKLVVLVRVADTTVTPELPERVFTVDVVELKFKTSDVGVDVAVCVDVAV